MFSVSNLNHTKNSASAGAVFLLFLLPASSLTQEERESVILESMKYQIFLKLGLFVVLIVGMIFLARFFLPEGFGTYELRQFVTDQGAWSPLIYIAVYIIAVIAFLPASPLSLLGGALFGPFLGTAYIVIAATIGAFAAFLTSRLLGRDGVSFLMKRYASKIAPYDEKLAAQGFKTVLTLRLIPIFPFNALNFLLGLTKVKSGAYVLGTLFGIIPGAFVFAYAGATAAEPSLVKILIAASIFGLLIFSKPIYKRLTEKNV